MTVDTHTLTEIEVEEFRDSIHGEVLRPDETGYDEARAVWNGMIDRRPALIARCTGVADVVAAVNFARENGLLVAVRGGGHNVAGSAVCDGGLVIDCSEMTGVRGDPETWTTFGPTDERLVGLKDAYDPTNLFRLNQNIVPTGSVENGGEHP